MKNEDVVIQSDNAPASRGARGGKVNLTSPGGKFRPILSERCMSEVTKIDCWPL